RGRCDRRIIGCERHRIAGPRMAFADTSRMASVYGGPGSCCVWNVLGGGRRSRTVARRRVSNRGTAGYYDGDRIRFSGSASTDNDFGSPWHYTTPFLTFWYAFLSATPWT